VFAHRDGDVVDVEGSATASATLEPTDGALAHTNDYLHPDMERFEGSPHAEGSRTRCRSAERLLAETAGEKLTVERLRALLSDHEGSPDSLCRHDGYAKTVFWCVADVTDGVITYGRGNPCESEAQTYAFA
jgi:hypothetical protein